MNAHGDAESMRRYGARIENDSVVTYRHLHSSFFDNCVDRTTCVRPGVFLTVTQCFTQAPARALTGSDGNSALLAFDSTCDVKVTFSSTSEAAERS